MEQDTPRRLSSGVPGLDEVLHGGLIPHRACLVRGSAGTGKTTLGFHFLLAGAAQGEQGLFISLGEPEAQIRANARSFGFDLADVLVLDLSPTSEFFAQVQTYDIFTPADVEREPTTRKIVEQVEALKPRRVVVDAMTQLRYLSTDTFQFRKQVLSFLHFLRERDATILFTSEASEAVPDDDLQFMADAVVTLELLPRGRAASVSKFRASDFRPGRHSMRITGAGITIAPRLLPEEYQRDFVVEAIPSGIAELDELLHGGLERGLVSIITGPTGVGKTTVGMQFVKEAARRGEHAVVYTFEEVVEVVAQRCEAVHIPVRDLMRRGTLSLVHVEPLRYTGDEFAQVVRQQVERQQARVVMLDGIAGYQLCVRGDDLVADVHALCKYLKNMGVTVLVVNETEAVAGPFRATDVGISYLGDNIVFLRYLECPTGEGAQVRKLIGVLKKRVTDFDKGVRELTISVEGVKVSKLPGGLSGVLGGTPVLGERPRRTGYE